MNELRVNNRAMVFERNGVTIPFGESLINESDWKKFIAGADEVINQQIRLKALTAETIEPLPETLNTLSPAEIRTELARTSDARQLRDWLWLAHENEGLWVARVLIRERMAVLGFHPQWTAAETAELDRRAPWRVGDAYKRMCDIDLPSEQKKAELKRRAYQEYQRKLAEIENNIN